MDHRICFVCLGNICRSPTAEAVMRHLVAQRQDAAAWQLDSCGTGAWHVGKPPDPRALAALSKRGYQSKHRARQLAADDYQRFDWLLVMDDDNLQQVQQRQPAKATARISKLTAWDPHGSDEVGDPYYGGDAGFAQVLDLVERCCQQFLQREYPANN